MGERYLVCNIVKCRKELKCQAWVTCCSHIFCLEHGQDSIDKEKCSACEYVFVDRLDIVKIDLKPSEQHKTMIMAGLSPDIVLDMAHRSLTFWTYQMDQERIYRDSAIRNAKAHTASIVDYCETLSAKHKIELQKQNRNIKCLENELNEKSKQIEDLVSQLAEKTRISKHVQSQNDALKRKALCSYVNKNSDECISPPSVTDTQSMSGGPNHNRFPPKAFQYEPNHLKNHRDTKENSNKDFIFDFQPEKMEAKSKTNLFNYQS